MIYRIPSLSAGGAKKIRSLILLPLIAAGFLAGCAAPQGGDTVYDPLEPLNREVHAMNKAVDKAVLRPMALSVTGGKGGGAVSARISAFSDNLGKPGDVVNNILQLRLVKAAQNTLRFGVNTVFGLGGLFDVATEAGMPEGKTDFGETLHVWGVGEGAYVELPLLGPSTARDALGDVVDFAMNPLGSLPKPEKYIGTAAKIASKIGDRGRYSETIDSILYDSADSYLQARLLYLQNRRYELGQTAGEDSFVDPYEDMNGQ